jgi:hypothetical protein
VTVGWTLDDRRQLMSTVRECPRSIGQGCPPFGHGMSLIRSAGTCGAGWHSDGSVRPGGLPPPSAMAGSPKVPLTRRCRRPGRTRRRALGDPRLQAVESARAGPQVLYEVRVRDAVAVRAKARRPPPRLTPAGRWERGRSFSRQPRAGMRECASAATGGWRCRVLARRAVRRCRVVEVAVGQVVASLREEGECGPIFRAPRRKP